MQRKPGDDASSKLIDPLQSQSFDIRQAQSILVKSEHSEGDEHQSEIFSQASQLSFQYQNFDKLKSKIKENDILASTVKLDVGDKRIKTDARNILNFTQEVIIAKTESCGEESQIQGKQKVKKHLKSREKKFISSNSSQESKKKNLVQKADNKNDTKLILDALNQIKSGLDHINPIMNFIMKEKRQLPSLSHPNQQKNSSQELAAISLLKNLNPSFVEENHQHEEEENVEGEKRENLKYEKIKEKKMEQTQFVPFVNKKFKLRKAPSKEEKAESDFQIPEFQIQQFPQKVGKKKIEQIAARLYQNFYGTYDAKITKIFDYMNGYQIKFDNGCSILWFMNGNFYIGEYDEVLKKNGKGFQFKSEKYKYHGWFRDGKKHGKGLVKTIQGYEYFGQWCEGCKNGFGKEIDPNGNIYEGMWEYNQYHGKGYQELINGQTYEGEFYQGMRHGFGVWKNSQGQVYKGSFSHNKKDGYGQYCWPDRRKSFKGQFKNGIRSAKSLNQNLNESAYHSQVKQPRKKKSSSMLKPIVRKISRKDEDLGYDIEAVKYKKYFENTTFRLKRKS